MILNYLKVSIALESRPKSHRYQLEVILGRRSSGLSNLHVKNVDFHKKRLQRTIQNQDTSCEVQVPEK